jgi:phage/plasmid primase-like uncharacterized protein
MNAVITDFERVRSALSFLSPDSRDSWVKAGQAIKSEFDESGFDLWDDWGASGEGHNPRSSKSVWKSFKKSGVGIGSLFYDAKQSGWVDGTPRKNPSASELAARHAEKARRAAAAAAEEAALAAAAAGRAEALWAAAAPAVEHPYLTRKSVASYGLRVGVWEYTDGETGEVFTRPNCLLIPVLDRQKKLHSLQAIEPVGRKWLLSDGAKAGNFYPIGKPLQHGVQPVFVLAEGYATAASVHASTGHLVLVCFDAGNLLAVARVLRERAPGAVIIVAADNDIWTTGNPGMAAAGKVVDAVGALVVAPPFTAEYAVADGKGPTDWNDWHALHGLDAVRGPFELVLDAGPVAVVPAAPVLPPRRVITVTPGLIGAVVDAGELALLEQSPEIYRRAGQIVRPIRGELVDASHATKTPATRLHALGKHGLVEELTRAADWQKPDGRRRDDGALPRINAPLNVAETLLARGQWRLRPLVAVIDAPTMRADGSLLDAPGYDAKTGLLLELGAQFGAVPELPTRGDAQAALERLGALVAGFPFVGPADRAVWLASVLTACVRRALPTSPMFAFSAPTAGSGKSLLVDLCAIISSGSRAPVFSQGRDEAEAEKRLGGALLAGHGVISFDNCTQALDGDLLCQALTQTALTLRPLGGSAMRHVPTSATLFATGNSLVIAGDMTRRALLCALDPHVERPELRRFEFNPIERAEAGRAGYLVDALIVLRAFHVAGCPQADVAPLGSFEAWSRLVRGALLWLDVADPVAVMARTREADPKLAALRAVLSEWRTAFGREPVRVRELIEMATETTGGFSGSRTEFTRPDFREALLTVAGAGGAINSRALGKWLSSNRDRIADGMSLQNSGTDRNGVVKWRLEENSPI